MLGVLVLAATFAAAQVCADCGVLKADVRLCAVHAEEERKALNEVRKPLVSKLDSDRIAALNRLSSLTASHVNAPSEKVARCLAESLADESSEVREHAARLLGPPQHALLAMEALLEALSKADKELMHLLDEEQELIRKKNSDVTKTEKEEKAFVVERNRLASRQEALVAWRRTLADQLGRFPDDRVVTALRNLARPLVAAFEAPPKMRSDALPQWLALKEARERLPYALDLNAPLVRLGSREAVRAVRESLTLLQSQIAELLKAQGTSSSLPFPSLREILDTMYRGLVAAADRTTQEIRDTLAERSSSGALPDNIHQLRDWLERYLESCPEHLPGVVSPAW